MSQNAMQKIDVDGETWKFRVGRRAAVILSPTGVKHVTSLSKVSDLIDRGRWKITSGGTVKPAHIRGYIRRFKKDNDL